MHNGEGRILSWHIHPHRVGRVCKPSGGHQVGTTSHRVFSSVPKSREPFMAACIFVHTHPTSSAGGEKGKMKNIGTMMGTSSHPSSLGTKEKAQLCMGTCQPCHAESSTLQPCKPNSYTSLLLSGI